MTELLNTTEPTSPPDEPLIDTLQLPHTIERSDIKPHPIGTGETEIVFQRHGKYVRDRDDPIAGSLSPEAAQTESEAAQSYFNMFLEQLPEEERSTVDLLVVASDTSYHGKGRRSYETAQLVQDSATDAFERAKVAATNILNTSHNLAGDGGPRPMAKLREPRMLNESPEFLSFMKEKHGDLDLNFWIAFEEDIERETRLTMGAEGPDEIADRTLGAMNVLARYSKAYHSRHPGRRLVIWAASHYDTISPFVKREVFRVGKEQPLGVDYGAGVVIDIDKTGTARTEIAGTTYPVPLKK